MNDSTLSTLISKPVKVAILRYCKQRGLKLRHFIEEALLERLEEEIDLEAYQNRKNEETVSFAEILKGRKK